MTVRPERRMLLDTASLYFRAFHGVPDTVHAPDRTPVNAVRGLLDIIARLVTEFEPTELVACWDDAWRPTWRVALIPTYKAHRVADAAANREEVPELLTRQVPIIREVLAALGIPIIGAADHEADDVIGTLASTSGMPVDVVTGDRDLFQLIDDSRDVRVIYTGRGMSHLETLTDPLLHAKYGVTPAQYADFAAMRGDASDGLPGVAGVGEKTAVTLLAAYGDLDGIIAAAADPASGMGAPVRAKILAASEYLAVAPTVVRVVRDLELPHPDARIDLASAHELAATWGLGTAMDRALAALQPA